MALIFGLLQGYILGSLLFNIFLADLFFIINNPNNTPDNNASCAAFNDIGDLINQLEEAAKNLQKLNPDKCRLPLSTKEKMAVNVNDFRVENSNHEKLLRVHFDNKLTFDHYICSCQGN